MSKFHLSDKICEKLSRLDADTRAEILNHIFGFRVIGIMPDMTTENETIRLLWPDILSEYDRLDKNASRMQRNRAQCAKIPPLSPKRENSPHTPLKEKTSSFSPTDGVESALDELFDRWWNIYPRHIGKKPSKAVFIRLMKTTDDPKHLTESMISAVWTQRRKLGWTKDRIRYIPHPLTWLNQARWEDEIDADMSITGNRDGEKRSSWVGLNGNNQSLG